MKHIQLTNGMLCKVDDQDYESLIGHRWYAMRGGNGIYYAYTAIKTNGKWKTTRMHRLILGITDPKIQGDHIDFDGLNNQRGNLRVATNQQNSSHKRPRNNTSSKYAGVWFSKRDKVFYCRIVYNYKHFYLGAFKDEKDAARAYDAKAIEFFGEFANLNLTKNINA